ncbi:MAG: ABC transporter permease [Phycisphaerae bacterium]
MKNRLEAPRPRRAAALTLATLTWRNLSRQPVRTTLTAMGVSIGVIAIVALGAIARGLRNSLQTGIHYAGSDLVIYQAGTSMDFLSVLDERETRAALLADPDIEDTAAGQSHFMTLDGKSGAIIFVIGLHPEEYLLRRQGTVRGRLIRAGDEIVIGANVEHRIRKHVGDKIRLAQRSFSVVGVSQTGNVFFDSAIVMDLETLQTLMGRQGKVTCFYARLRPGADPYAAAERLERVHPELAAIADASQYKKIDQGLEYSDAVVLAVSFLALVIGSLIVANTMWMAVNHRTREIGVLRAVGWARRSIMTMILLESAGIGIIACIFGCGLGVGLAELTTVLPTVQQFVDPLFHARTFGLAVGVTALFSLLGAAVPAYRAARISPVEALRHE